MVALQCPLPAWRGVHTKRCARHTRGSPCFNRPRAQAAAPAPPAGFPVAQQHTGSGLAEVAAPFVMPALTFVSVATYGGVLGTGLSAWQQALLIAAPQLINHGLFPLLDVVLGPKFRDGPRQASGGDNFLSRLLPALVAVAYLAIAVTAYWVVSTVPVRGLELVLLSHALAVVGLSAVGSSHELIHSTRNKAHQAVGELLLMFVWWHPYARAHHQHHLHVATGQDFSSARKGEGVYAFMPRYILGSYAQAFSADAHECRRSGHAVFGPRNKTFMGLLGQVAITAAIFAAFGPVAATMHAGLNVFKLSLMSVFDYVLHYGLQRPRLSAASPSGATSSGPPSSGSAAPPEGTARRFAPVTHYNSFNSFYSIENTMLFNALHHSDHHVTASKSYRMLQPHPDAPQFPLPLNWFAFVALIPPLWFALMDKRAADANAANERYLAENGYSIIAAS